MINKVLWALKVAIKSKKKYKRNTSSYTDHLHYKSAYALFSISLFPVDGIHITFCLWVELQVEWFPFCCLPCLRHEWTLVAESLSLSHQRQTRKHWNAEEVKRKVVPSWSCWQRKGLHLFSRFCFINAMCMLQLAFVCGWASFPKTELLRITGAGFFGMDALRIAKPEVSKHQRKSMPCYYYTTFI